jgi:hypothetical protein
MQAHCNFIDRWDYQNNAWATDALTITVTHIPFGRIAAEIVMGFHHVLATVYDLS